MTCKLLFVCLGNICRSPAAEAVFQQLVKTQNLEAKYIVDSAGTGGWHVGGKPDSRMIMAASKRGVNISSIARQFKLEDFNRFDLILTMDNDNYETIMSLAKKASFKDCALIKPILSFARKTKLSEVPDPYYGGELGFEKVLDLLEDACSELLKELEERF